MKASRTAAEHSACPTALHTAFFTAVHDSHRRALERATGESFNIFRVLGIGHLEVRTHSPILGELLDPKGSHGQGGVFLKLFLDQMRITDLKPEQCQLRLDYFAGPVKEDSGGRIDLVIQDHGSPPKAVIIENKIFAADQPNQLLRYRNKFPGAHLLSST